MFIDNSGGMPPPQVVDIQITKKNGTLEKRPVEESGNSDDTKFDNGKHQEVDGQVFSADHDEVVMYNSKGDLANEKPIEDQGEPGGIEIDMIV